MKTFIVLEFCCTSLCYNPAIDYLKFCALRYSHFLLEDVFFSHEKIVTFFPLNKGRETKKKLNILTRKYGQKEMKKLIYLQGSMASEECLAGPTIIIYPLTVRVIETPHMISKPVSPIFPFSTALWDFVNSIIIIVIYPLTMRVAGAPQMTSLPVSSIFPCSPVLWDLTNSRPVHSLMLSSHLSSVCLVFFPLSL